MRFIGGPYDGQVQPGHLPEGERLNMPGNMAGPPQQSDDESSTVVWEGAWHTYVGRLQDGEWVAVYEPHKADPGSA